MRVTFNKALKGDLKALVAFLQLIRPAGLMDEEPEISSREAVGAEDEAILAEFLARHGIAEEQDSREEPSAEAELPSRNRRKTAKKRTEGKK